MAALHADVIIIGAGSAGCVLADRLSADGDKVLLLEAGPEDRHPFIRVPAAGMTMLKRGMFQWPYATEPDAGVEGRSIPWPRGRVLGGSSAINGMNFVRGAPQDFDRWAQMGAAGWSYDEVLPFFRSMEDYPSGDPAYRGRGGPLAVEDYTTVLSSTRTFVAAAQQAGFAYTPDINGARQEGVGYSQMSRRGRFRASSADAFLKFARRRPNLRVETEAVATRLLMESRRCIGVAFQQGGEARSALAAREVILCGGAINSPQLLQVSGIGAALHLRSIGVEVAHDLPGVGANLADHISIFVAQRVRGLKTMNDLARGLPLAAEVLRYLVTGKGALTFGATTASVFCRSHDDLDGPDLQLLFMPASFDRSRFGELERAPGVSVAVCPVQPHSRGTVLAISADAAVAPAIRPNYLSAPQDVRALHVGVEMVRSIFAAPAFAMTTGGELSPGPQVDSLEAVEAFARKMCSTAYHPVGTCRMGADSLAVVDPRTRVHGVGGLRVVDASIMPTITSGNTNAPTMMIGERAAALILEDARGTGIG